MGGRHLDPDYHKKWWEKNKHKYRNRMNKSPEISKRDYENNKEKILATQKARREHNPEWRLWKSCKGSASKRGLDFDIEVSDIKIPELCPVLLEPMVRFTPYAPSVDRIDNSKGYVKGNVQVISKKANSMKGDATYQELIRFAKWILRQRSSE